MSDKEFDVLIVGSGLAGLTAALLLAPTHRVAILTKRAMGDGSSGGAQGGIAALMAEGDSFESHVDDTLVAGAGLSDLASRVASLKTLRKPLPGCKRKACRFHSRAASFTWRVKAATVRAVLCMR